MSTTTRKTKTTLGQHNIVILYNILNTMAVPLFNLLYNELRWGGAITGIRPALLYPYENKTILLSLCPDINLPCIYTCTHCKAMISIDGEATFEYCNDEEINLLSRFMKHMSEDFYEFLDKLLRTTIIITEAVKQNISRYGSSILDAIKTEEITRQYYYLLFNKPLELGEEDIIEIEKLSQLINRANRLHEKIMKLRDELLDISYSVSDKVRDRLPDAPIVNTIILNNIKIYYDILLRTPSYYVEISERSFQHKTILRILASAASPTFIVNELFNYNKVYCQLNYIEKIENHMQQTFRQVLQAPDKIDIKKIETQLAEKLKELPPECYE